MQLLIQQYNIPWLQCHDWIFPLANYTGLKILLNFFPGVVFSTPRDLLISFRILSFLTPWLSDLINHGYCYVPLPWLDSAWAGARFLVGQILASCIKSACWLQCADKRPWWLFDVQKKMVHTTEFCQNYITRIPWHVWLFWPETYLRDDLGVILLAKDDSQHIKVLQELPYIPEF